MSILYSQVSILWLPFCLKLCNYYWSDAVVIENLWFYCVNFLSCHLLVLSFWCVSLTALYHSSFLAPVCLGLCILAWSGSVFWTWTALSICLASPWFMCAPAVFANNMIFSSTCFGSMNCIHFYSVFMVSKSLFSSVASISTSLVPQLSWPMLIPPLAGDFICLFDSCQFSYYLKSSYHHHLCC